MGAAKVAHLVSESVALKVVPMGATKAARVAVHLVVRLVAQKVAQTDDRWVLLKVKYLADQREHLMEY